MAGFLFLLLSLASLSMISIPDAAFAHEHWLGKETGAYALHLGHRHSQDGGVEDVSVDVSSVKGAWCVDATGVTLPVPVGTIHPVKIRAECAALLVTISSGYWSKTETEVRNLPRTEMPTAIKSWLSEESIKRIDQWTPATARPIGRGLEISPVSDPTQVRPGFKLTVRVTEDGKPKSDVAVAYADSVRGNTGADGTIAIRIREPGVQMISASYEAPLNDGRADVVIRASILQFAVPE